MCQLARVVNCFESRHLGDIQVITHSSRHEYTAMVSNYECRPSLSCGVINHLHIRERRRPRENLCCTRRRRIRVREELCDDSRVQEMKKDLRVVIKSETRQRNSEHLRDLMDSHQRS